MSATCRNQPKAECRKVAPGGSSEFRFFSVRQMSDRGAWRRLTMFAFGVSRCRSNVGLESQFGFQRRRPNLGPSQIIRL